MTEAGLVIIGTLRFSPEDCRTWLQAAAQLVVATRQEPGCIDYSIGESSLGAGEVVFYECYADKAALMSHVSSLHMAEFVQAVASIKILEGPTSRRFVIAGPLEIELTNPLLDSQSSAGHGSGAKWSNPSAGESE